MKINHSFASKNFDSRQNQSPQYVVLHYTQVPLATTLGIFMNDARLAAEDAAYFSNTSINLTELCRPRVSSHYVVAESGEVYQLVEEAYSARHAGVSYWNDIESLNKHSIGIELVNLGFDWLNYFPHERGVHVPGSDKLWCRYAEKQIEQTVILCQNIMTRHHIQPDHVVGHGDIACGRKLDPGPLFPWQQLAEAGVGLWPQDPPASALHHAHEPAHSVLLMQQKLSEFGYRCLPTGEMDRGTIDVMKAFQMHFRPSHIDGNIDLECLKIIDTLCQQKRNLEAMQAPKARP